MKWITSESFKFRMWRRCHLLGELHRSSLQNRDFWNYSQAASVISFNAWDLNAPHRKVSPKPLVTAIQERIVSHIVTSKRLSQYLHKLSNCWNNFFVVGEPNSILVSDVFRHNLDLVPPLSPAWNPVKHRSFSSRVWVFQHVHWKHPSSELEEALRISFVVSIVLHEFFHSYCFLLIKSDLKQRILGFFFHSRSWITISLIVLGFLFKMWKFDNSFEGTYFRKTHQATDQSLHQLLGQKKRVYCNFSAWGFPRSLKVSC